MTAQSGGERRDELTGPVRFVWLVVPALGVAIAALAFARIEATYGSPLLFTVLNIVFQVVISLVIASLAAISFLRSGSRPLLFLGCGSLALGLGSLLAAVLIGRLGFNAAVTVYDTAALLAGACYLFSSAGSLIDRSERGTWGWPYLAGSYLTIVLMLLALIALVRSDLWPTYFVEGSGSTALDTAVLYTAIALFALSAILLRLNRGRPRTSFRFWYSLALALIAIGLVGISLQLKLGDPLNWVGRSAQYVGGLCMLIAVVSTARRSGQWLLALEATLRASEERYRIIGEVIAYGVWATDAAGKATYISPSFCELVGKSFEEIRDFGWLDALVPEQREEVARQWMHSVDTGEPFEHEHHFVAANGEIRIVLARGNPVRNDAGRVVSWAGINLDITERKRGEAELRETRDYLENLLGYANAPVIVWDPELRITRFNRAFEELTQRAASEVVGQHLELLFPEDDRRREALAHVTQASAGERWQVVEIPILRADGEVRTVLWNSATVYAADGETPIATIAQGQDVTERIAAEHALRESEDTFKYIFDYSPLGKSLTLPTGEVHVNRAFCRMLGYSRDELEHTKWQDITHPEDLELTQKLLDPILSGHIDEARFTKRYLHKDGSIVWADVATSLRRDEAGEPLFFVTAVNDITEQRLAQDSLGSSEERYRELVDHMTSGVVVYEPTAGEEDFTIREFNIAAQGIEQLDRAEIVGRLATDAFPGVEEFGLLAVLRRVARTGEPEEFPTAFYQDQRLASWRENHIYRLPSGEVVAVYENVTERVRAEREAAHSKELMERAEEIGHAGGWEYDVARDRVTWTDEVYRIYGLGPDYDPNDAGRDIDFYSQEGSVLVTGAFRKAVEDGEAYDLELELDRADGVRIWVRTIGRPVVEDGVVVRVLGNIMDISERRRAEEEVLRLNAELEQRVVDRTAQLEAVNKELEAFAYSVSHDLRAPLRHISGYASILASDSADVLDDDGRHCLDTISESVREMGVLIDDLLQFSRVGRAEMKIGRVDMEQTLAQALEPIRQEANERNIEWAISPLPHVTGDPALLRQVWANLIDNAVKYSRDSDPARIEVSATDGDPGSAGDARLEDVFFVRDNGVGFDMQYAHKLFGVFQRLHSSAEFEGTGIGLANVERIITRHGGRVWAEAEPNQGATFYFALPRRKETRS